MPKKSIHPLRVAIPARPEILLKMNKIMSEKEPDIDQIIAILKQDAGLYSITLATVNSPQFAINKKITSISHAIMLLGLPRLFSLIKLVLLKSTLSKNNPMERFWDTATEVANITQELCSRYTSLDKDNAYSIGMLHDCGVPILMQTDKNYKDTLKEANSQSTKVLLAMESAAYGIDHFTLGAKLVKAWQMPADVFKTILLQASFPEIILKYKSNANNCLMYLSLLSIAKDISRNYRYFWRLEEDIKITPNIMACLEYIGLCDYDYLDLKEEYIDILEHKSSL